MRTEQSGSTRRPLVVNDQFFEALDGLIAEWRESVFRAIAEKHSLPLDKIRGIAAGDIKPIEPEYGGDRFRETLEEYSIFEQVHRELEEADRIAYNLTYSNGYSIQTDVSNQVRDVLAKEPGRPDWLSIRAGPDIVGWASRSGYSKRLLNLT